MSDFKVTINCKKCNDDFSIIHHGLIDIDNDIDLYEKLDNKTIFNFKCPKCGGEEIFRFPFLCYSKRLGHLALTLIQPIVKVSRY